MVIGEILETRRKRRSYLFATVIALSLLACIGDPNLSSYTKTRPKEADLIGTYVPDKSTIKDMHDRGAYSTAKARTSLTLRADGTFEMIDMPDWWREPFGTSHGRLESDFGTWRVAEHTPGGWWELAVDFPKWGGTVIPLSGKNPPYVILFVLGDPDSSNSMSFVRLR